MNPLNYGKLILKIDELNLFILQINKTNIVLLKQYDLFNSIKLFREGNFMFEYKDHKINDSTFIRSLQNKKFTFKNNNLIELSKILALIFICYYIIVFNESNTINIAMAGLSISNIIYDPLYCGYIFVLLKFKLKRVIKFISDSSDIGFTIVLPIN